MDNKNPLSPHIQIYKWHISSLVSISHRITGIINIISITLISLMVSLLVLGQNSYETINLFLSSLCFRYKCFVSLISNDLDPDFVEEGSIRSVG